MNAKKVVKYFAIYQDYIWSNNLLDDSSTIEVDALIEFVEEIILENE